MTATPIDVLEHEGLVKAIVGRTMSALVPGVSDVEDLAQDGWVGMIQAARKFDLDAGVQFSSYVYRRVQGQMADRSRSLTGSRSHGQGVTFVSLSQPFTGHDDEDELGDTISDPDAQQEFLDVEQAHENATVRAAVSTLGYRERTIYRIVYVDGRTLSEAGLFLGVSVSRVSQLHAAMLDKIRKYLAESQAYPCCVVCGARAQRMRKGKCSRCYATEYNRTVKGAKSKDGRTCSECRVPMLKGQTLCNGMCRRCYLRLYMRQRRAHAKVAA